MVIKQIKDLLLKIKNNSTYMEELKCIQKLQNIIWDDKTIKDEDLNDILTDTAYILDFYEPDADRRKESPNYYDSKQLTKEVNKAISKISQYEN